MANANGTPCTTSQEPGDIAIGEMTYQPSRRVAGGVTIEIKTYCWNRLCAAFGLDKSWYQRQPLRRRKHGGRWPSYRDVRTRWRAVQYEH